MTSFCSQRCLQHTEDTKLHVTDIVEGTESFRSTETVEKKKTTSNAHASVRGA